MQVIDAEDDDRVPFDTIEHGVRKPMEDLSRDIAAIAGSLLVRTSRVDAWTVRQPPAGSCPLTTNAPGSVERSTRLGGSMRSTV